MKRKRRERYRKEAIRLAAKHGRQLNTYDWDAIWRLLEEFNEPEPVFLYAAVDYRNRLVKFGRSVQPGVRLKQLRTGNGNEVKLWAYCLHETPFTEKEIHLRLAANRIQGEWFRLVPDVQQAINEMRGRL